MDEQHAGIVAVIRQRRDIPAILQKWAVAPIRRELIEAVAEGKFDYAWISHDVTLALSALTTITVLQQEGYSLMPL